MPSGTVKFFNMPKGFGFITPDEGGKEIFLPLSSLAEAGIASLQMGQRVTFEVMPDKRGPKAVGVVLLATPTPAKREAPPSKPAVENSRLTLYWDPSSDESRISLSALRGRGVEPRIVDVIATPPTRDELIRLSHLLNTSDQSLMKKYDPLFRELRLDDRFISQNDVWDAIIEHPSLIHVPLLVTAAGARICRSEEEVVAFLEGRQPKQPKRNVARSGIPLDPTNSIILRTAKPSSVKVPTVDKPGKQVPHIEPAFKKSPAKKPNTASKVAKARGSRAKKAPPVSKRKTKLVRSVKSKKAVGVRAKKAR